MAKLRCMGCMREYEEKKKSCPYCGYTINAKQEYAFALQPQTVLQARYIVGTVLRCGKEEIIYLGWDQVLDKRIAIKEYYPQLILTRNEGQRQVSLQEPDAEDEYRKGKEQYISDAKELARFREETGIIRIYDYFEQNATVYVITEYSENYRRKDVATRMLYRTAEKYKKGKYIGRTVFGVELTVLAIVMVYALFMWRKPYAFFAAKGITYQSMPDIIGEQYEQAKGELEKLGLQIQKESYITENVSVGKIVMQSISCGEEIQSGQVVVVRVAEQPEVTTEEITTEEEKPVKTTRKTQKAVKSSTTEKATEKKQAKESKKSSNEKKTEATTEVIVIED